ncbi:outer membrane beta-barrel protein [Weeksellaceae bacterium TAE3-ERU29]|nr:outer membrane beta-barrel protein [Weeksellaceae bacterium TAE3-ERU29]
MKKSFLFLSVMLMFFSRSYGQTNFYVESSGNYSFISKSEYVDFLLAYIGDLNNPTKKTFEVTENYDAKVGFDLGFGFNKKIQNRIWLNLGLGWSYHEFKKKRDLIGIRPSKGYEDMSVNAEEEYLNGDIKTIYASVPVLIKYEIIPELFRVGVGVTNYFIVSSKEIKKQAVVNEIMTIGYDKTFLRYYFTSNNVFNNYQLNGDIQMEYKIAKSFWLQANYNHGFLNIYDDSQKSTSKYRTIALGLRYDL